MSDVRGAKSHRSSAEEASKRHNIQVNGIVSYMASWFDSEDRNILQASINMILFFLNIKLFCRRYKKA